MGFGGPIQADEPCGHYFGNVCTGFGGSATCMLCGWDRHDHPEEKRRIEELLRPYLSGDQQPAESAPVGPEGST
jgi:hypothetical protein